MPSTTSRAVRGSILLGATLTLAMAVVGFRGATAPDAPKDAWLNGLNGTYRQIFDTPSEGGGIPLIHVMNYYDTYNSAYGVEDSDINTVTTLYGGVTFHGLNDAMWAKYKLGEFLKLNGSDGQPATANPWRTAPVIMGTPLPGSSIEALQKRGATFILCNNALGILSGLVAQTHGLQPNAVYEDMKANILPGVELVPAMVIAIGQAQSKGLTYLRN